MSEPVATRAPAGGPDAADGPDDREEDGDEPYEPSRLESVLLKFGTAGALLAMLARGGRWWMLPLALLFLVAGVGLLFLQSIHYVAPFIYMVF